MNLIEKEKDVIGFAHKVISFRMNVIKACKAKGIEPPTDEQISEYINSYGFHLDDFMADYTEHEGIFIGLQTPFEKFVKKVEGYSWGKQPTKEELKDFFEKYGDNIDLFSNQRILSNMNALEKRPYLKTISKLSSEHLVKLWNIFIDESGLYGSDSHIFNLSNKGDMTLLSRYINTTDLIERGVYLIQHHYLSDGKIVEIDGRNMSGHFILPYWREIFERIMLYPSAYNFNVEIYCEGDGSVYFDDVFFPIIAKEVGYIIDGDKGTIKKVEEN